jgi:hypothetical protein
VAAAFGEAALERVAALEQFAALERVAALEQFAAAQGILPAVRNRVLSLEKATVLRARSRARAYRYLRFIIAVFLDQTERSSVQIFYDFAVKNLPFFKNFLPHIY